MPASLASRSTVCIPAHQLSDHALAACVRAQLRHCNATLYGDRATIWVGRASGGYLYAGLGMVMIHVAPDAVSAEAPQGTATAPVAQAVAQAIAQAMTTAARPVTTGGLASY